RNTTSFFVANLHHHRKFSPSSFSFSQRLQKRPDDGQIFRTLCHTHVAAVLHQRRSQALPPRIFVHFLSLVSF
ncbi:hypothetical protein ACHAXN_005463, partial [Cyclotella atomus]